MAPMLNVIVAGSSLIKSHFIFCRTMSDNHVIIKYTKDWATNSMPVLLAAPLDQRGRLNAGCLRRCIAGAEHRRLRDITIGQGIGVLRDGTLVADTFTGHIYLDKDGVTYGSKDLVDHKLKELVDCDFVRLAGSECILILVSDGSLPMFDK